MAGEGIEYTWGCAKNFYRSLPIKEKKSKEKFREAVRQCLSNKVISKERVVKFAIRARRFICAYHALASPVVAQEIRDQAISPKVIERLVRLFKVHRAAIDFDTGFIQSVVNFSKAFSVDDGDDDER